VRVPASVRDPAGAWAPAGAGAPASWSALAGAAAVGVLFLAWGVRPGAGWADLPLAAAALGAIGVAMAVVVAWAAQTADRYAL
jgi:hypothetical protein